MFGGDDDDHYDEFGNYTGPAMNEDVYDMGAATAAVGWGVDDDADVDGGAAHDDGGALMDLSLDGPAQTAAAAGAVVLHEDKQYYPDAEEVYPGVKVAVMDEDTQPLEKPILDPVRAALRCECSSDYDDSRRCSSARPLLLRLTPPPPPRPGPRQKLLHP